MKRRAPCGVRRGGLTAGFIRLGQSWAPGALAPTGGGGINVRAPVAAAPVRTATRGIWAAVVACLLVLGQAGPLRSAAADNSAPLRFGFSGAAFVGVNESDVRAALKIWAQTLGAERGIPADPVMQIFPDFGAMKAALVDRKVDAVTMMAEEYWAMRRVVPLGSVILGWSRGIATEEYLLLVHRDSPVAQLADLRGKSISFVQGSRGSLAPVWLETLLLEGNLGTAELFWGKVTNAPKLSRVVLPVFFGQATACVVTREGLRTMVELNPQVGRQLKILAESPPLIPAVFCFRDDCVSAHRDRLVADIARITDSVAGRQALTLFQSGQLIPGKLSDMDDSCALLDRHERLLRGTYKSPAAAPSGGGLPVGTAGSP